PPRVTLFPYTTLFRAVGRRGTHEVDGDPDRDHTHDEDRAQRRREIAPRNALDPLGNTQRADLAGAALLRHQHSPRGAPRVRPAGDRKSTRLNSSHQII